MFRILKVYIKKLFYFYLFIAELLDTIFFERLLV